jgi:hypothetical protein
MEWEDRSPFRAFSLNRAAKASENRTRLKWRGRPE